MNSYKRRGSSVFPTTILQEADIFNSNSSSETFGRTAKIHRAACKGGVAANKKTQIAVAQEMQNWAIEEINGRLSYHLDVVLTQKVVDILAIGEASR